MDSSQDTWAADGPSGDGADDTLAASPDQLADQIATSRSSRPGRLARGDTIGRYVVLHELGAGGMGVVYAAYDPELDRKVALKMLLAGEDGSRATQGRARLLREAQALAKFSHPEIVAIHDVGEHAAGVWIAMEFVEGQTLSQWASHTHPSWPQVLEVMQAAGRGVAAAHAMGLVHRDLKPDNIMLAEGGRVRVMDFGLTRVGRKEASPGDGAADAPAAPANGDGDAAGELTRHGSLLGTPAYMSPEQWSGDDAGEASDQFSFAVTAWELLYGERPFAAPSLMELAAAVTQGRMRAPPSGIRVPGWLRRALERGLATNPGRRWPSMQALLDELARGRGRRRRRWVAVGVLALAGLIGGLRAEMWRREHERVASCDAEAARIEQVWNEASRTRVRDAIAGTGLAYAATTNERVIALLDARAHDWQTTRRAACLDASEPATAPSEADLRRAQWCFDERAMEIDALVDELEAADALVVQKAVSALVGLPRVDACGDVEQLRRRPDPPVPEQQARVGDLHRQLARAATLEAAGQYETALALAQSTLADAEAGAHPPLIAAARARVGRILEAKGDSAGAVEVLTAAYFEAVDAAWPEKAAETAAALWVIGAVRLSRPEADLWGRLAESGMRSAGVPPDDVRWLRLALDRGSVYWIRGQREDALETNREAIVGLEAVLGPDHPDIARGLNVMGNALHKLNRPDEAYAVFLRSLEIREHAYGPDHPEVASSMSNVANALASMERYEDAAQLCDRAIEIATHAVGEKHQMTATIINNSFFPLQGLGRFDEAAARLRHALALRTELLGPNDAWTTYTRMHLADLQREAGDYAGLHETYEQWIASASSGGSTPGALAGLELGLIEADIALGHLDGARERLKHAMALIAAEREPDSPPDPGALNLLSRLALAHGNLSEARSFAERSLAARDPQDVYGVADARLELAKVLGHIPAQKPRAIELMHQARESFVSLHADGRVGRQAVDAWLAANAE